MDLEALKQKRLSGTEEFHNAGEILGFNVRDFWSWSVSDLVSNATKGILLNTLWAGWSAPTLNSGTNGGPMTCGPRKARESK